MSIVKAYTGTKRKLTGSLRELQELAYADKRRRYPNIPDHALTVKPYSDKTANGLTRAIIDFLKFEGWQAERINCTGRIIDKSRSYVDAIGRHKKIGSSTWIPTSGQRGTADISSTIAGRSVKIEIKTGKDRQSPAQAKYQRDIERSGGVYFIARSWEQFREWYNSFNNG